MGGYLLDQPFSQVFLVWMLDRVVLGRLDMALLSVENDTRIFKKILMRPIFIPIPVTTRQNCEVLSGAQDLWLGLQLQQGIYYL